MNCFGYSKKDDSNLLEMKEVTLQANTKQLKGLADFLYDCAKKIEDNPEWEHAHFQDSRYFSSQYKKDIFDLIVYKEDEA